ncbi:MAG: TFIIB-type zinc ribbon-containing protein [Candidatus Nitrosocaldus sp.]
MLQYLLDRYWCGNDTLLHYNMMIDTCKHSLVYDEERNEHYCERCGIVLALDEACLPPITRLKDIGWGRGRTPLWQIGLGSKEGSKGDDTSILSNIADKLELPSYAMYEFLQLYRSFVKHDNSKSKSKSKSKRNRVLSAKLALSFLLERYNLEREAVEGVVENAFNYNSNASIVCTERIVRFAKRYGIAQSYKLLFRRVRR